MDLSSHIRAVPDFPKPGILFRDITPLLGDPAAFTRTIDVLAERFRRRQISKVVGIESRGFLFGAPLALELKAGFIPIRKEGKLPGPTLRRRYSLEYGEASIEMHADALQPGERVLIVDDLLATGGTARAAAELVEEAGGQVAGIAFIVELAELDGRTQLLPWEVHALISYGRQGSDSSPA
jgi:adenine phosphoribosyltransferase